MDLDPLKIAYFLCDYCDKEPKVLVAFCVICSNIACPHLFLGDVCFQCARIPQKTWPDWHLRFPLYAVGDDTPKNGV